MDYSIEVISVNQMMLIKNKLEENLGKKVIIKAEVGRKKYTTKEGILKSVYSSIFLVDIQNGDDFSASTFTYSDVLTQTVKIIILDDVKNNDIKKIS
ncbi:Veg family protein [Peptoniphilus mikwangii]|uniref:Veg family protein n=1 Tax=Peptoniphilus mikwangii TaxID=1354300 RepID=UPI002AA2B6FF|nr:Veg family protein [Peptoniphilus mikwangii]